MAATDVIRVRIGHEQKRRLMQLYERRGSTISREVRAFLEEELAEAADPVSALDAIADSAQYKTESSALPDPTVDDIVAYVDRVREERTAQMLVSA